LVIGESMRERWPTNNKYFSQNGPDTLYVRLQAYKISTISTINAGSPGIKSDPIGEEMIFLMPSTYSTTITHEWENVDQIGTRAVQKYQKTIKSAKDIKGSISTTNIGGDVITSKIDTPITFKDSNRRTLNLTINLSDQGDTKNDVFYPVRKLEKYSCASKGGVNNKFDFELPYIFEVETFSDSNVTSDLIYMKHAALLSVQPTYYGPYRKGYPSKCELTLSFRDMEPLYRNSFERR